MQTDNDSLTQKLTITKQNRHQYLKTSFVSASRAEREITLAEARGRKRLEREKQRKATLVKVSWCLLAVAIAATAIVLLR